MSVTWNGSTLESGTNGAADLARLRTPRWHGWHAARRGLGGTLHRLGVAPIVIQHILIRHSNVSTTADYYIKTAADDVRNAMEIFEKTVVGLNGADERT
jgi:hypothetical protein